MSDSAGTIINAAYPGMAITVSGWKSLPNVGDEVLQASEGDMKKAVVNRVRRAAIEAKLVDVEAINASRRQERELREIEQVTGEVRQQGANAEGPKELRLVIKGDVSGSVEAAVGALQGIGNKDAAVKIICTGVGDVSESDVMMAKAIGGKISCALTMFPFVRLIFLG
jgi:translation initiation factor IF-2